MTTQQQRWKIRDKRLFLIAVMEELAGTARISFEGDLSATRAFDMAGASKEETPILKRNTLWPQQDFIVLPLETESAKAIIAAIGGTVPKSILHIQIEKSGRLELGLYDNFDPRATFFGLALTPRFLSTLQFEGIITHWTDREDAGRQTIVVH
jgi:hypothetical protein